MSELKIGDTVIDIFGNVGTITSFCECEICKERGFFEPTIKPCDNDMYMSITDYDYEDGYSSWYKLGDKTYPEHIDMESITKMITENQKSIERYTKFLIAVVLDTRTQPTERGEGE